MGEVMPSRRAMVRTGSTPVRSSRWIAAVLTEWASASRSGIGPWKPFSKLAGCQSLIRTGAVVHQRIRRHAGFQRRQEDHRLEGGTGLAQRLGGAVELARPIAGAADQRPHRAVRPQRHQGALIGPRRDARPRQHRRQAPFRRPLQPAVHGRVDDHVVMLLADEAGDLIGDPVGEIAVAVALRLPPGRRRGRAHRLDVGVA